MLSQGVALQELKVHVARGRATSMTQTTQQQREHLIRDGLNVPCQLANEHGGQGLRYQNADGSAPTSVLPRGYVLGVYPGHAGRQPSSRYHLFRQGLCTPRKSTLLAVA